jgi:hypothetical protein
MRRRNHERGQVLPLVAICLAVLMGFAGLAVDVGYAEYQQRQQQAAADAGAIGGAQQMLYSGCGAAAAGTSAIADAARNGFTNGTGGVTVTPTLGSSLATGNPFAGNSCAIQVQVTAPHPTWFATLFGFNKPGTVTTQAVALIAPRYIPFCAMSTATNGLTALAGSSIAGPSCSMQSNGRYAFSGSTVNLRAIGYAGSAPSIAGSTFTEATPAPTLPFADPCPEIAGCAYVAANPPSISNCQSVSVVGTSQSLNQGCFNSLTVSGATLTLTGGTYVINGPTAFSGATITGSNVTIYVTSNGEAPQFAGDTVNLSAPTTGNQAGVLYYQVPSNTSVPNFAGTSNNLSGLIYAPSAVNVGFAGSGGGYTLLVVGSWSGAGSTVNFPSPSPQNALLKQAVLAE